MGRPLVPIGEAFANHMILLMAADGSVFAAMDDTVVRIAASGEEAIDALCEGREPEPLP